MENNSKQAARFYTFDESFMTLSETQRAAAWDKGTAGLLRKTIRQTGAGLYRVRGSKGNHYYKVELTDGLAACDCYRAQVQRLVCSHIDAAVVAERLYREAAKPAPLYLVPTKEAEIEADIITDWHSRRIARAA